MTGSREIYRLRDKARGCFLGTAIGDALGMPVEGLTQENISKYFGSVTGYLDSVSRFSRDLKRGQWTDDTKLTLATARGLIKACFDGDLSSVTAVPYVLAEYLKAFQDDRRGFGKTTRESLQDRLEGKDPFDGRHPKRPGNGCAMKIAPLGILESLLFLLDNYRDLDAFEELILGISRLTHNDSRSLVAAVMQAYAASDFFDSEEGGGLNNNIENIELVVSMVKRLEQSLGAAEETPTISEKFQQVPALLTASDDEIARALGTSGAAYESFPLAFTYAIKYRDDFRKAVLAGVNAGGDTDTVAAMSGALVGARLGADAIPEEWKAELEDRDYIISVADELWGVAAWMGQ